MVEVGVSLATITPSDPLGQFVLPVPAVFGNTELETLIPSQRSLNLKLAQ